MTDPYPYIEALEFCNKANIAAARRFKAAWEKAEGVLRQMLVDPPSTLDEPDTDAEVLVKLREIVREYFAENIKGEA